MEGSPVYRERERERREREREREREWRRKEEERESKKGEIGEREEKSARTEMERKRREGAEGERVGRKRARERTKSWMLRRRGEGAASGDCEDARIVGAPDSVLFFFFLFAAGLSAFPRGAAFSRTARREI